jgi:RNA polymerase sigma factor (sigma-70 family)
MPNPFLADPTVRDLILKKARLLAKRLHSPVFSRSDHEQQLVTELLAAMPNFDPERGTMIRFVSKVLYRAAYRVIRDQITGKRSGLKRVSSPPVESIADPTTDRDQMLADLNLDLAAFFLTLTPDQQDLVRKLKERTPSELAREMGIPRSTLQSRIRAMRLPFAKKNLEEFL